LSEHGVKTIRLFFHYVFLEWTWVFSFWSCRMIIIDSRFLCGPI
jgi:hypothetical protein